MTGTPAYGRLRDVNTTSIEDAARLGCEAMQDIFNPDDDDRPYMISYVRPKVALTESVAFEGHLPGRHLNALLNAEAAFGVAVDEAAIRKHRRALLFSYSGPVPLPLNRRPADGPLTTLQAHNVREGFHGLTALARYRADSAARELAEASIAAIFALWDPDGGWNMRRLEGEYGVTLADRHENFVRTLPRAIGPLVKYYRCTRSAPALELAVALKNKLLRDHFSADGSYAIERQGTHGHSIACVLSSLAQLAELTRDPALFERVRAFYDNGMWQLRDDIGWVVEKTGESRIARPDVGESNSTGDLIETALILGRQGRDEYFEDAERMLRCHLLPSQLRDIGFVAVPPNPRNLDAKRDVARRVRGSWCFPAPYGHEPLELDGFDAVRFHLDVVGGVVGSLCEVVRDATRKDAAGHHVNLLFDHETEAVRVESVYTQGSFTVTLLEPGPLWLRIPSWLSPETVTVHGLRGRMRVSGQRLLFPAQPVGVPLKLTCDLPVREIVLRHRTRRIRVRLHGDAVTAMDNFGADLTFFPAPDPAV